MCEKEKNNSWSYIDQQLYNIEKYYGIYLDKSFRNSVSNLLINELLRHTYGAIPNFVYAICVDGKIRKGRLRHEDNIILLAKRSELACGEMTEEKYEKLLTKTNMRFTYCDDDQVLYSNISQFVGRYIMRHKLSSRVIELVTGESSIDQECIIIPLATLFDMYLSKERGIFEKKDIIQEEIDRVIGTPYMRKEFMPMQYIQELILRNNDAKLGTIMDVQGLKKIAKDNNVPFCDFSYNIMIGLTQDEALNKTKEDAKKYGFINEYKSITYKVNDYKTTMNSFNYNLIQYIEYKSRKEELELGLVY